MELLRKGLHLGTGWPLWTIALITAVAVECIILLYRYEQSAVGQTKGRWLTALRLLALVARVWMLLQPVFSRKVNRELEQEVIVVMDDSASMDLVDPGQTASRYDIAADAIIDQRGDHGSAQPEAITEAFGDIGLAAAVPDPPIAGAGGGHLARINAHQYFTQRDGVVARFFHRFQI